MTDGSTTTTKSAAPASHKTGVRKKAAKKKSGSRKATKKGGAKAKSKKTTTGAKRRGKNPDIANRIRLSKQQDPNLTAQEIANDIGCSVNYVYLKWGAPKRGKAKKGGAKKVAPKEGAARKNGGGAEVEFRHALRLVGLERARQLLDAFEREE